MEKLDGDRLAVFNVPMIRSKLSITGGGGSIVFNAGTTSGNLSAISFADSNGISFGLNAGTMTASVAPGAGAGTGFTSTSTVGSNVAGTLGAGGLSIGIPAYLTTAMASNAGSNFVAATAGFFGTNATGTIASNGISVSVAPPTGGGAGTGFTTATTAGTNIVGTLDTNGLSMGVPAYLTTAALSQDSSKYAGTGTSATNASITLNTNGLAISVAPPTAAAIKFSAGTLSSNRSDITFGDSNGVSFGLDTNGIITATVATNYLTTAMASNASTAFAGIGETTATVAGTALGLTVDTAGVNIAYPNWLTTAALSQDSSKYAGIGETTTTQAGTALGLTVDTAGVNIAYPVWLTTAALSADSSKYAGTGFTTATTAGTNLVGTLATNGLSMGVPAWLTAASATAAGGIAASNSQTLFSTGTVAFSEAGGAITIASAAPQKFMFSVPATTVLVAAGGIVLSSNGSTLTISATNAASTSPASYWQNLAQIGNTTTTMVQSNSFYVIPLSIPYAVSVSYLRMLASMNFTSTTIATSAVNNATGASTAFSETVAWNAVLYTAGVGASSRSLQQIYSSFAGLTWAASVSQASTSNASRQSFTQAISFINEGNAANVTTQYSVTATNGPISTTQWSNLSAQRYLDIPFGTSLSAGVYWLAFNRFSGTVGGKNMDCNATIYGVSNINLTFGNMNSATNLSNAFPFIGLGVWTQAAAGTSASIGLANISATTSYMLPFVQFVRQA